MIEPIPISLPTPFLVGPVNSWLLPGDEPLLVDVGPRTSEAWAALVAGLAANGLAPRDLRHIFITHAHVDHYGNAERLAGAAPAATIYAPDVAHGRPTLLDLEEEWERQYHFSRLALQASGVPESAITHMVDHLGFLRSLGSAVPVSRWVRPGERLSFGQEVEWEVVALPGHSMTQVGLRQANNSYLIAADHLLPRISSNALLEPPAPGERRRPRALPRYMETLRWTADLPPHRIFPGHGDPFTGQQALIERRLRGIEERASRLYEALQERPHAVIELVQLLFPKLNDEQLFLAVSEVAGHLDVLESRTLISFRGEPVRQYFAIVE